MKAHINITIEPEVYYELKIKKVKNVSKLCSDFLKSYVELQDEHKDKTNIEIDSELLKAEATVAGLKKKKEDIEDKAKEESKKWRIVG